MMVAMTGALVAAWLSGCGQTGPASAPSGSPSPWSSLDEFEQGGGWTLDSANDYAALATTTRSVTSGGTALQVDYADNGRDKAVLRKEVDLDLSGVTTLAIDALEPGDATVSLALALRVKDGSLYETVPMVLRPGWNRDLVFTLDEAGFKKGTDLVKWRAASTQVNRLLLHITPAKGDGRLVLDSLRYAPANAAIEHRDSARIVAHAPPAGEIPVRGLAEIALDVAFPADAVLAKDGLADTFLRRMTAVQARVAAPDGTVMTVNGFCCGIGAAKTDVAVTLDAAATSGGGSAETIYHYRIRISPHCAGEWRYQAGVTAGGRWSWRDAASFVVSDRIAGPGPIAIDQADPRWFARADGSWFYPLGENVAWSGDYAPYVKPLAASGGNFLRTWMCPWNHPLDIAGKLDVVNFGSADQLDAVFAMARSSGVAVQLCLQYHGILGGDWGRNPFNKANGGPCTDAREFWSSWQARALFKRQLDYVVARWGYSPDLFAWELWNEADLTPRFADADIVSWHREMAAYLRENDPHHHLVTTSTSWAGALPELWKTDGIDICQIHLYDPRSARALAGVAAATATIHRPVMVAEIGRGWEAATDQVDPEGRSLRQALWSGWMLGFAGGALPWWWDTHLEPNQLTARFAALAAYAKGEDPRGHHLRTLAVPLGEHLEALCLIGPERAYGYVFANDDGERPRAARLAPLVPAGKHLVIAGIAPGAWTLEIWDTLSGKITLTRVIQATDEGAVLELPAEPPAATGAASAPASDLAFKLTRRHAIEPGLRLE